MTWPAIYVEAAFGANLGNAVSTYSWTDISYACPGFTVSSPSRDRFTDAFQPGTASFTLDNSGRLFDPFATSGTYTSGGVSLVRPNLPIRVRVVYSATTYYLFTGYVDTIDVRWDDPGDSVTTLTATDGFSLLAGRLLARESLAVGGTGARVGAILDAADWPAGDRDIATGLSRMIAKTTDDAATVLGELQWAADHEHGLLYLDGEGQVVFRDRAWPYTSTSWTLSDAGGGALEYTDLRPRADAVPIINYSTQGNSWSEATFTAVDSTSAGKYGRRDADRFDWEYEWDAEVESWTQALVDIYAEQIKRFDVMTTNPTVDDALWPMTLGALLGQRASITRTPPGGGSAITRVCFISGRTDTITTLGADTLGSWETTWKLEDASSWPSYTIDGWDSGAWDSGAWFY